MSDLGDVAPLATVVGMGRGSVGDGLGVTLGRLRGYVDSLCLRESLPKAGGEELDHLIGSEVCRGGGT